MKYFILNTQTNHMIVCHSFDDFIRWFAYRNYRNHKDKLNNHYFDDIAMNLNDTKSSGYWDYHAETYVHGLEPRTTMIIDSDNRIIDPRHYKKEILNYVSHSKYPKNEFHPWERVEFRKDPIPRLFKKGRIHRGSYMRKPRTFQERKCSCDDDVKDYIRPSRNKRNLVNSWDDIPRHNSRSWKNKKVQKQWMKNLD